MRPFLLMLVFVLTFTTNTNAMLSFNNQVPTKVTQVLDEVTNYMITTVESPKFGTIGGEWLIFGLARRGANVPENYYENYYTNVAERAKAEHSNTKRGWSSKITETQRLALAVASIGKDPQNVGGVNLIDYSLNKAENMPYLPKSHQVLGGRQGLNELIFGLLTLNLVKTPNEEINPIINTILTEYQTLDGGFAASNNENIGDLDITSITLQALAPYYNLEGYENITTAVNRGIKFLQQKINYNLTNNIEINSGNVTQIIVALTELKIDPNNKSNFNVGGKTLVDTLLDYYINGSGFEHIKGQGINQMATEQCYYALVAYERFAKGISSLYDISVIKVN